MRTFTALSTLALTATFAHAQCFTDPLGAPLGAGDETVNTVTLGFPFTMPDGVAVTDIDITSNGRITANGAGVVPDFSPTAAEFVAISTIAPYWDDLDFSDPTSDDIYFQTTMTRAVIQFNDAVYFGFGLPPFSFSVILNSDNTYEVQYDNRLDPTSFAIVGYSDGSGIDPGPIDLSTAIGGAVPFGSTAYEDFNGPDDIRGNSFLYLPNGPAAGYSVLGTPCGFASVIDLGGSCNYAPPAGSPISVSWFPDSMGVGGYTVVPGTGVAFDPNIGASVAPADDSISTQALGFSFTMPGGTIVTDIDIDSNGRIMAVGADATDFSPTVAEMLNALGATINPFHVDLNATNGGDVSFFTDNVSVARITWDSPQFGAPMGSNLVFQLQLDGSNGSWSVVYQNITAYDNSINPFGNAVVIGCSQGNAAVDPGESDVSVGIATAGDPTQYELIDDTLGETQDLQVGGGFQGINLTADLPTVPGMWNLALDGLPTTALFGVYGLGLANLNAPLSFIDATNPCTLFSSLDLITLPIAVGGTTDSVSINLSTAPLGLNIIVQALVADPMALPTPIFVITSNGLDATTGF